MAGITPSSWVRDWGSEAAGVIGLKSVCEVLEPAFESETCATPKLTFFLPLWDATISRVFHFGLVCKNFATEISSV